MKLNPPPYNYIYEKVGVKHYLNVLTINISHNIMSDILDPDKWGLLHQEGVTLVEQAVRKLQDGDCPLDYAERTVSRIDNLILECKFPLFQSPDTFFI